MDNTTTEDNFALARYEACMSGIAGHLDHLERICRNVIIGKTKRLSRQNEELAEALDETVCRRSVEVVGLQQEIEQMWGSFSDDEQRRVRELDGAFETATRRWSDFTKRFQETLNRSK